MRIIAVDDEPLMLEKLCRCIREAAPDEEMVSFKRPSEALTYIDKNHVDVAFLDVKMRGMDGIELGKRMKITHSKVNIIFCTGY